MLARKDGGVCTPALGAAFASMTTSPRTGRFRVQRGFDYGRLVTVFDVCVLTGRVSLMMSGGGAGGMAVPQCADLVALGDAWSGETERRGLAAATRSACSRAAREYQLFLEANGITSWEAADGTTVFGYLESLLSRWAPSAMWSIVTNFRPFLTFTQREDLPNTLTMARIRRWHQLVPVLA